MIEGGPACRCRGSGKRGVDGVVISGSLPCSCVDRPVLTGRVARRCHNARSMKEDKTMHIVAGMSAREKETVTRRQLDSEEGYKSKEGYWGAEVEVREAPDMFNFLRYVMRAILSVRPKCSHRCVSLKETLLKPVQNPPAHNQKLNRANRYENEML